MPANATNISTNACYRVLSFLEAQPDEWTVSGIAKELGMPRGTVSWVLKRLKEQGKVFFTPKGKCNFYAAVRRFTDDFNRLFKAYGTKKRYEIHGLTLKLEAEKLGRDFTNLIPEGGGVVRDSFDYFGGVTSFQLSRGTFMVWGSFTNRPLDYDRFLLWLSAVDGFCASRGWPKFEGNMRLWLVRQYGFNRDWKRFRNDSPTRCVSLQGFKSWFARCYQKEELGVMREEIHSREERSLEEFVHLVDGSMTSVQVMNFLELVVQALNKSHRVNADLVRRIGKLADKDAELTKQVKELSKIVSEIVNGKPKDARHKGLFRNALGERVE